VIIDRLIESDGHELFNTWFFNRNVAGLKQLLTFDHVYPGLADTGAHAGQICDADMGTHYLTYWARDRKLTGFADAVRRITSLPAQVLGLQQRGTLAVGHFADINVFDVATLASEHPTYANDFPNGAGRLKIGSRGYAATLVNGQVVTEQGTNTGARPGTVIREFSRS
jgi:N-acyl-D-amino-acid deacylase